VGGAQSTKLDERFDLVPFEGIRAAARRFALGAAKYAARQWEGGDESFAEERINHLVRHTLLFAEHRRQEDLDALLCNGMMMAFFKSKGMLAEAVPDATGTP